MKYLLLAFVLLALISCNEFGNQPVKKADSFLLYCKWSREYRHKSLLLLIEGKEDSSSYYLGKANAASDAANYEYSKLDIK